MRYSPFRNWLEIAEYLSLSLSVAGAIATIYFQNSTYVAIPIILSLLLNFVNRRKLQQQSRTSITSAINQLNQHKAAADQLIEQLTIAISSLTSANVQLSSETIYARPKPTLKPLVLAIKKLRQQQKILQQTIKLIQAEISLTSQQFKRRPELEQIENLTSVILDLQQFINQLPQWGNLQQRQLIELQEKVESALAQLSTEIANLPHQVEAAVQQREIESNQKSVEQLKQINETYTNFL